MFRFRTERSSRSLTRTARRWAARITVAALASTAVAAASASSASAALQTCYYNSTYSWYQSSTTFSSGMPMDTNFDRNCSLSYNLNYNDSVKELQRQLVICNGFALTQDGKYGGATRDAISALQRRTNITVDGKYGPQTRVAMRFYVTEYNKNTNTTRSYCGYAN